MKFNEKIITLRKIKGITQDELANAVGVSRQAVYKWESGQSYPEVTKLLEIKILFGISIDDLLDDNFEIAAPEKKKRKRTPKPKEENTVVAETVKTEETPTADYVTADEPAAPAPAVTEPAAETVETIPTEEAVAVPVSQNSAAVEETAAPAEEKVTPAAATEAPEKTETQRAEPEKKVGFFGRLFGRK